MEDDTFDVAKIDSPQSIKGLGRRSDEEKGKRSGRQPFPKKEPRQYLHTLAKAVEATNGYCAKKGLPYRFRVYMENNEVFIDQVVLDANGKPLEEKRKNISHEDFARLIEDISNKEGLFFDGTV